jgi:hypothetical protein
MLTEARSDEAKLIRKKAMQSGKDYSPRRGKILVPRKDKLVNAVTTSLTKDHYVFISRPRKNFPGGIRETAVALSVHAYQQNHFVLGTQRSIDTPQASTKNITQESKTMETSQKSTRNNSLTLTALSAASLASHSASLENVVVSKTPEGHSFLISQEYCDANDLPYSSLKTLKGFSVTTVEELLQPSSPRLMNWGMTVNGKLLTARITESPKTGNESSLSVILEEHPDPKYFLSPTQVLRLLHNNLQVQPLTQTTGKALTTTGKGQQSSESTSQFIQQIVSTHQKELAQHSAQCKEVDASPIYHLAEMGLIVIRKLTPLECERLQAFPDGWTL